MEIFNSLVSQWLMIMLYFQFGCITPLSGKENISSHDLQFKKFDHLAIHKDQGTIFISGGDNLIKLSPDLELLAKGKLSGEFDNTNIFINYKDSELIACGGADQYLCSSYDLNSNTQLAKIKDMQFTNVKRSHKDAKIVSFLDNNNLDQNDSKNSILYIAISYDVNYNNLDDNAALFVKELTKNSRFDGDLNWRPINLENSHKDHRNKYSVRYVYGFSSGQYNYIVTIQQKSATPGSLCISKLIRICYNDTENEKIFYGYTEIPIECKSQDGKFYNLVQAVNIGKPNPYLAKSMDIEPDNDVLFGVFSKSQSEKKLNYEPSKQSALCIFSLKAINEKFTENIRNCYRGSGYQGFNTTELCIKSNTTITSNFCSSKINMPLVGSIPVSESPVIAFDSVPTAIATNRLNNRNNIFIGIGSGEVMKIVVNNITNVYWVRNLSINERLQVNLDLIFSPNNDYLYVMTKQSLSKIKLRQNSTCSTYNAFDTCLQMSALMCGWDGFTHRCASIDDTYNYGLWYSYDFRKDVKIISSSSQKIQIGTVGNIQLNITHVPQILDTFVCNFFFLNNKSSSSTKGSLNQTDFNYTIAFCEIPEKIPPPLNNEYYSIATLSISATHIPNIAKMNVSFFFNCGKHNSCKACSSEFSCMWCPKENKCAVKTNHDCLKSNPTEFKSNVEISSGKHALVEFPGIKSFDVCNTTSHLKCLISIDGKTDTKNVVMIKNSFFCENMTYAYAKNVSNINATVGIVWGNHTLRDILSETKVNIYKCQGMAYNYTSCSTLNAKCNYSWCQSSNRCEFQKNCDDQKMKHSIVCSEKNCSVTKSEFQIGAIGNIQLSITTNVSQINDNFSCYFIFSDNKVLSTQGSLNQTTSNVLVTCEIPKADKILRLPKKGHYWNATLSFGGANISDTVKTKIKFFDCKTYSSCKECFSSGFSCTWCPKQNKCTFKAISDCLKEDFTESKSDIIIASGKNMSIEFPSMKSFDVCNTTSNLTCVIIIGEKNETKNVVMRNGNFYCENTTYTYVKNVPNINATVTITWNTSTYTDILSKRSAIVYKCKFISNNCTSCLTLNAEYNCGWCQSSNTCQFRDNCKSEWIDHLSICPGSPYPSISSFSPLQGPLEGGTDITIKGESLGYTFQDINQDIEVAGVACKPIRDLYIPTKSVTCGIKKLSAISSYEGPVVVYVNKKRVASEQNFKFAKPKIWEMSPNNGPVYGGTELTIKGENLNVGKLIKVFIGKVLCLVFSLTPQMIKCVTNSSAEQNATVRVEFDQNVHNFTNDTFEYKRDPDRDEKGYNIEPKGIPAGGVTIFIRDFVPKPKQKPFFQLYNANFTYKSQCKLQNYSILTCPSPHLPDFSTVSIDQKNPQKMDFSITDDTANKNISFPKNQVRKFLLYPNPEFHHFLKSTVQINEDIFVIIKGRNINKACQIIDIKVNVSNYTCDVISISSSQLICRLPKSLLSGNIEDSEVDILAEHDKITVSIGEHFNVTVLRESNSLNKKPDTDYILFHIVILAMIIISIVLIVLIVFFCVISKKTVTKTVKKLKKTQLQMTRLELRVASECKEAFAELQTQAAAFKVDDHSSHLPFLNYHNYVINILFPNIKDHSIILSGKAILIHKEKGLRLFEELIMNKRFLLSFVKTLEKQESFSMNDRVYVASMIMITLQKNMEYCTDILKTLLAELIEKNMQGKSHPKLLLRRTESVVEKMLSAWFSFLLFEFFKKSAGQPLFNLFHAIKEHVNKGPIDMITSHARYCLSENKILRLKFDYCPLTIYVNISRRTAKIIELESAIEKVPVQVLDCDTISQFKEKAVDAIHRTTNFTRRLNSSELYVKWFRDTTCTLILSDDDSSSMTEGEWRRKNTLKHYKVPDGSVLSLISDQEMNYRTGGMMPVIHKNELQNNIKFKLEKSIRNARKKSLTESTTALIPGHDLHLKEWHLIKPHDSQVNQGDHNDIYEIIPEIYLTRLLATKSSLQRFVDGLFMTIFKKTNQSNCFPLAIKYMFDFLDDQARLYNITDPEVVHVWKNNCLPLRFWVNLIKNGSPINLITDEVS